ncbi:hypothetical protein EHQ95_08100 [Leptospira vanthielii]|uniref:Uncharacterized protein n=1 Tax=Leptospira vanthielii TaxID=293085 RepID=A0ABY2NQ35_9LEPT|nr:hypothetical protein EHQ95_08100 [Leptospira vanthielii]
MTNILFFMLVISSYGFVFVGTNVCSMGFSFPEVRNITSVFECPKEKKLCDDGSRRKKIDRFF